MKSIERHEVIPFSNPIVASINISDETNASLVIGKIRRDASRNMRNTWGIAESPQHVYKYNSDDISLLFSPNNLKTFCYIAFSAEEDYLIFKLSSTKEVTRCEIWPSQVFTIFFYD